MESLNEEQYKIYFRRSTEYYYNKTIELNSGRKYFFNPYAFFFGYLWLLYRKQYKTIGLFFLLSLVTGIIEGLFIEIFDVIEGLVILVDYFVAIVINASLLGFYVDKNYIKNATIKLKEIQSIEPDFEKQKVLIKKVGGTSPVPFIIITLFFLTILTLVILGKMGVFGEYTV